MSRKSPPKIAFTKPSASFAEQIRLLQQRGLVIRDITNAEFYLRQLNYYRFAAYCLPYEQDHVSHTFIAGTQFEQILNLYVFDRELRLLVLDAIERFEVSLRTQIAYQLSQKYQTAHPHLKPELFGDLLEYANSLGKLTGEVKRSREEFIKHLTQKYQEPLPPIWACVELLTMGQLSRWYSNIKLRADRQIISKNYGLDEKTLSSFCEHLSLVRNLSAHHARLWNRDFTKTTVLPRHGDPALIRSLQHLPDSDRRLRKIYNTLVMLGYIMDLISGEHHWKQRLIQLIDSHKIDIDRMGFPADWKMRLIWQQKQPT
ncbi:Abi family protein [Oceanospirillum linum]|uniref:DNA-binding protein n=1 Tax=Oceanospirillum linum TaxID=966 RepID=A0A1T1HDN3_OCELI|nr:Abi family protein [Oceanospirillum linum]OOV87827.1 hypothetical protein BTA35_0207450 [Oceanospirillum linum]SEG10994.1 Abortive infection bacteriophage resistance protein [Oleiphilus messinensis]SMP09068.1 Abortive infection bacteriophage resistance protein [Oceanospirillum linum]